MALKYTIKPNEAACIDGRAVLYTNAPIQLVQKAKFDFCVHNCGIKDRVEKEPNVVEERSLINIKATIFVCKLPVLIWWGAEEWDI